MQGYPVGSEARGRSTPAPRNFLKPDVGFSIELPLAGRLTNHRCFNQLLQINHRPPPPSASSRCTLSLIAVYIIPRPRCSLPFTTCRSFQVVSIAPTPIHPRLYDSIGHFGAGILMAEQNGDVKTTTGAPTRFHRLGLLLICCRAYDRNSPFRDSFCRPSQRNQ